MKLISLFPFISLSPARRLEAPQFAELLELPKNDNSAPRKLELSTYALVREGHKLVETNRQEDNLVGGKSMGTSSHCSGTTYITCCTSTKYVDECNVPGARFSSTDGRTFVLSDDGSTATVCSRTRSVGSCETCNPHDGCAGVYSQDPATYSGSTITYSVEGAPGEIAHLGNVRSEVSSECTDVCTKEEDGTLDAGSADKTKCRAIGDSDWLLVETNFKDVCIGPVEGKCQEIEVVQACRNHGYGGYSFVTGTYELYEERPCDESVDTSFPVYRKVKAVETNATSYEWIFVQKNGCDDFPRCTWTLIEGGKASCDSKYFVPTISTCPRFHKNFFKALAEGPHVETGERITCWKGCRQGGSTQSNSLEIKCIKKREESRKKIDYDSSGSTAKAKAKLWPLTFFLSVIICKVAA